MSITAADSRNHRRLASHSSTTGATATRHKNMQMKNTQCFLETNIFEMQSAASASIYETQ